MEMKKTWFSYLLWLLFLAAAGILSAVYLSAISMELLDLNSGVAFLLTIPVFAGVACIWFLGHKAAEAVKGNVLRDTRSMKLLECALVMCLLAGAVLYRVHLLRFADVLEGGIFYDMASIKSTGGVPEITHGASYCYTVVLSAVLAFSGNKAVAGVFLQIFLQILSLLLVYFALRRLTGRPEAFCAAAIMAFLPMYARQIYSLTPEVFYFLLFAAGVFGIGWCTEAGGKKALAGYAAFFAAGGYAGIMGYLDISGYLLLLFVGSACICEALQEDGEWRKSGFLFFACLLGAFSGTLGCMAADAFCSGNTLKEIGAAWMGLFAGDGGFSFPVEDGVSRIASAAVFLCSMLGGIGFCFHKKQKQDVWILFLLAVLFLHTTSTGPFDYKILLIFVWSTLAAIGIASMGACVEEEMTGKAAAASAVPDIVLEDMDAVNAMAADMEEEKPKIKLIENPLPLPKKHVKRQMDFDRVVEPDQMKYDYPVDESDDFDIK